MDPRGLKAIAGGKGNAKEAVYQTLKGEIVAGVLKPREPLSEHQIAARLGVSRTPVREALNRMAAEGLVEVATRGMVVADLDVEDVRDIYQVRTALESLAARLSTHRFEEADFHRMEAMIEGMADRLSAEDYVGLSQITREFHWFIVQRCGNRHLVAAVRGMLDQCQRFRAASMFFSLRRDAVVKEHRELVEAFRSRDAEKVAQLMVSHLERAASFLVGH
ncbi:MAG TPA: GntR family transcriptional regulator [Firmicutes bacterium]|nr:GntR family transcriptional regulator [Bacillota bacterium]